MMKKQARRQRVGHEHLTLDRIACTNLTLDITDSKSRHWFWQFESIYHLQKGNSYLSVRQEKSEKIFITKCRKRLDEQIEREKNLPR